MICKYFLPLNLLPFTLLIVSLDTQVLIFTKFNLSIFSLSFESLIIMCLSVDLFKFILLEVHWASWLFIFMSFIKFRKFSAIISSNIHSSSFSLSFPSGTPMVSVGLLDFQNNYIRQIFPVELSFSSGNGFLVLLTPPPSQNLLLQLPFLKKLIYFIYFWQHWVFVAVRRLSVVEGSGGYSLLRCAGFSLRWLLLLWSMGSRHVGFSSCGTRVQ